MRDVHVSLPPLLPTHQILRRHFSRVTQYHSDSCLSVQQPSSTHLFVGVDTRFYAPMPIDTVATLACRLLPQFCLLFVPRPHFSRFPHLSVTSLSRSIVCRLSNRRLARASSQDVISAILSQSRRYNRTTFKRVQLHPVGFSSVATVSETGVTACLNMYYVLQLNVQLLQYMCS